LIYIDLSAMAAILANSSKFLNSTTFQHKKRKVQQSEKKN